MESTLFSKNEQGLAMKTILLLLTVIAAGPLAAAGTPPPTPTEFSGLGDVATFWSLTKLGGGISIAIFGVLAIGLFLIVFQVFELMRDKVRGRALTTASYHNLSLSEVSQLVMNQPNSLVVRLYSVLLSIFQTTGSTRNFHDEIANYIQLQHNRFGTFRSRLSFLSDTAGALGLLGTVWGMFVTFFGGNLDSQRILNGMGLALVTTLIGLVVSIILNFCATEVYSIFNKRLELISSKADEFRLWLMAIVQKRQIKANGKKPVSGSGGNRQKSEPAVSASSARPAAPSFSLRAVSELKRHGAIGQPLTEAIMVAVESGNRQRVAGMPVRFEVVGGGGTLDNRKRSALVKTDGRGIAHLHWTLGPAVGPQRLEVAVPNLSGKPLEFVALARPFIPHLTKDRSAVEAPFAGKETLS